MTVLITLTVAGADTGPTFDLFSDVDGYLSAFETSVPKASLLAGYISIVVPDGTTLIKVIAHEGVCLHSILIPVITPTTSTTTTSTTAPITTTTTTTLALTEYCYEERWTCDDVLHQPDLGTIRYWGILGEEYYTTGYCYDITKTVITVLSSAVPDVVGMDVVSCPTTTTTTTTELI